MKTTLSSNWISFSRHAAYHGYSGRGSAGTLSLVVRGRGRAAARGFAGARGGDGGLGAVGGLPVASFPADCFVVDLAFVDVWRLVADFLAPPASARADWRPGLGATSGGHG